MSLNPKRRAFIEHYLQTWNATEAARRAGYSERSAYSQGHRLLKNAEVQEAIQKRLAELKMSADEVLVRLSAQARADISEFVTQYGAIDWGAVQAKGWLVRKVKHNAGQHSEIDMHDAQTALKLLGQAQRLFINRHEVDASLSVVGLDKLLDAVYGTDSDDDAGS